MPAVASPVLPAAEARRVLAASRGDVEEHAAVALLLVAGLRPQELEKLRVEDWTPGTVRVGGLRSARTVRVAPLVTAAVDAYLATQATEQDEFLLPRMAGTRLVQRVRACARAAGVEAGVHDLRKAAVGAGLAGGLSTQVVQAYFGMFTPPELHDLLPVPDDYDVTVAGVLQAAFG